MKFKKKGQALDQLQALIVPIVGIGIVLVVGFLIMAEAKTQLIESTASSCTGADCNTSGLNGTNETINALATIPGWLPIIVITVIGIILIGLVSRFRGS